MRSDERVRRFYVCRHSFVVDRLTVAQSALKAELAVRTVQAYVSDHGWSAQRARVHGGSPHRLTLTDIQAAMDSGHGELAGSLELALSAVLEDHHSGAQPLTITDIKTATATLTQLRALRRDIAGIRPDPKHGPSDALANPAPQIAILQQMLGAGLSANGTVPLLEEQPRITVATDDDGLEML